VTGHFVFSEDRQNSEIAPLSTSSVTKVSGQTLWISFSLETRSPGCSARHAKKLITFGARWIASRSGALARPTRPQHHSRMFFYGRERRVSRQRLTNR